MLISSKQNDPHRILCNRRFVWLFQTFIYGYLNEGDKVSECCSCLKMMKQAMYFLIKRVSPKRFHLYGKLAIKQNFKQKIIMKCLAVKICIKFFANSQSKKYNCNSTHSCKRKIWVDIPSYIIFSCYMHKIP